jgi:hypothetical protein
MNKKDRSSGLVAQAQIIITIDCLPDGNIGFGCHGGCKGNLSQEATEMLAALQDTINRFARANGVPGFDCSKVRGAES